MRRQAVILLILLLAVSGCATARSAQKNNSEPKMVKVIGVGGQHCH